MSKHKYLLYIDTALVIDENYSQFVKNNKRKEQILHGLQKLMEYDFMSKGCDILFTDNTIAEVDPDIQKILPEQTIYRVFNDNRYGRWNKGAGLMQKWLYNKDILNQYDYILYFEARLELFSYSFFDRFFQNPKTYFRNGDSSLFDESDTTAFTGLFTCKPELLWKVMSDTSIDTLIIKGISIESVMLRFFKQEDDFERVQTLDLYWYCFDGTTYTY